MDTLLEVTNKTLDEANVDIWFKTRKEVSNGRDPNSTPSKTLSVMLTARQIHAIRFDRCCNSLILWRTSP